MRRSTWGAALLMGSSLALAPACSVETTAAPAPAPTSTTPEPSDPPLLDHCLPPPPSTDWCDHVAAGPAGKLGPRLDLAVAHAAVRFFGVAPAYADVDQALAQALVDPAALPALAQPDLPAYTAKLPPGVACAPPFVAPGELPGAGIGATSDVAVITPGKGSVGDVSPQFKTIILDLTSMPAVPGLRKALEDAIAPFLTSPVPRPRIRMREHHGLTDEIFSATNVYKNAIVNVDQPPIPATGTVDRALVLYTGPQLAPEAAELAATLRLANRAWIFGEDVRAEVAESRWAGVWKGGIAYRYADLLDGNQRWPDVIPADRRMNSIYCYIYDDKSRLTEIAPPALTLGPDVRPRVKIVKPFQTVQPAALDLGAGRAALLAMYGAIRLFFPDGGPFPPPAPDLDASFYGRLQEIETAAPLDRAALKNALRGFGAALRDGHAFVFDYGTKAAGSFLVMIEDIDGAPVVRRSATPGVDPGDTITTIAGVPAAAWYKTELARTSAGTDGYRFNVATRRFLAIAGPTAFDLVDPDGKPKKVTVDPQPSDAAIAFGSAPSLRKAGSLADLGAPSLYYINLGSEVLASIDDFRAALTDAAGASGLVLDMRGYPGVDHYEIAERIIGQSFGSPRFFTPLLTGPDQHAVQEDGYTLTPLASPSFAGKVALLVGHGTVSAAENFATMLVDAQRVTVVGRQSAGTNGNITGVQVPGAFGVSFTGMKVTHADKSPFLGIGILPDVPVTLTAKDFRDGVDPELVAAIQALGP